MLVMNKKRFAFWPKNIIVAIVLATLIVNTIKSCPLVCTCKWKGGKRKVECASKNLTSLITNVDSDTQVLDFSKNHLHTLSEKMFEKANLTNLQKLYISDCQITQIHEIAFHGLSNLIELDLSGNVLTSPPSSSFNDFPLLMKLMLSANPIRVLKSNAFSPLKYLATLDLSDCQIDTIERDVFDGLRKLEWLKLEGNKLKNLKHPETLPEVTGGLSLHRNPWTCDCHLRTFHAWLATNKVRPLVADPVCEEPAPHRAVPVAQLKTDDLACAPCVIPSSLFVEINEGKNISFVCQVSAVPEAEITWEFEGTPVSSNSSFVYPFYKYYAEEATTEQVSELFVYDAKKENNGTYRCTAENVAGKSTSNYTLKVISTQKEIPPTITISYFHIVLSSVSTILIVTLVTLFLVSCFVYVHKKKPGKEAKRSDAKPEVEYEIMKQNATETPSRKDRVRNPDLIINAESNLKELHNCEHLLLLPNDLKQTYLTLAGNTLLNTAIYESKALCTHEEPRINLVPASSCDAVAAAATGTIKLYLSPTSTQKLHNLYVNPFDGYVDSIERNCWTFQLSENDVDSLAADKQQHVLIDCCNQTVHQEAAAAATDNAAGDLVNLRHNLEGYPYPSKLKLTPVQSSNNAEQIAGTPILSPPDPFKTNVSLMGVDAELSNRLYSISS